MKIALAILIFSFFIVTGRAQNVGVGTSSPGAKLEVAGGVKITDSINVGGQVRITNGQPGDGKVLTSNANGIASWQAGSSTGLFSLSSGNASISSGTYFIGLGQAVSAGALSPIDFPNSNPTTVSKFNIQSVVIPYDGTVVSFTACLKGASYGTSYEVYLAAKNNFGNTVRLLNGNPIMLTDFNPISSFTINAFLQMGETICAWVRNTASGFNDGIAVTIKFVSTP
jgi:hypothetical protein